MNSNDLVRMANQIAIFFAAYPDDQAAAMVADHINKFWAPRMRDDLAALLADDDGGLKPLARKGAAIAVGGAGHEAT